MIFVTDGEPATSGDGCTNSVSIGTSGSRSPYQQWVYDKCVAGELANSTNALGCTNIGAIAVGSCGSSPALTHTQCTAVGGSWNSGSGTCRTNNYETCTAAGRTWTNTACKTADNSGGPGHCTYGSATTEMACELSGGVWAQPGNAIPNPSSLTRWTNDARAMSWPGTWGNIDIYAVYYSAGASTATHDGALYFLNHHVVMGKGADLGTLDAPTGAALTTAMADICTSYTSGAVGLIE